MSVFVFNKVVKLDKSNANQGTSAGDFVVPTNQDQTQTQQTSNATISIVLEVYKTESDARARADALTAELLHRPDWDSLSPLLPPDAAVKVLMIKRQTLHTVHSAWEFDFAPAATDPLLGKSIVGVRLPCADAAGNMTLQIVTATVASATSPFIYRLSYPFNAMTFTSDVDKTRVEGYLAESDARLAAAGAVSTISIPSTFNTRLSGALKAMPKSNTLSDTASFIVLDVRETFSVLTDMAPSTIGAITLPAIISQTSDKNLLAEMGNELERINAKFPNATIAMARTFTQAPDRLGKELLAFMANPGGASAISNHHLADRFRVAAMSSTEWDDFLLDAAKIVFAEARRAIAATAGEHVMKGGLDRYIDRGKDVAISYLDSNLGINMTSSQLLDVFLGMAGAIDHSRADRGPITNTESAAITNTDSAAITNTAEESFTNTKSAAPSAFGGTHMPPIHLHMPAANQKASTEADNRLVNQLRADAFIIQHDAAAQRTLKMLMVLKDANPDMFLSTVKIIDDERLLRLLNTCSDKGYSSILQGGFEDLGLQLSSIRSVIERNLEKFILGEQSSDPPERVTKAFRNARLGRIDKLKLFHLVDIDDSGTPAAPLAALVKINDRSVAFGKLSQSLDRLQQILCITYPRQISQIINFIPKFKTELEKIIVEKNVAWPSVTAWFKAITQKISRPALLHSMAEGEWGGPKFQLEWLKESCDYNYDLQEAKLEAMAYSVLGKRGTPDPDDLADDSGTGEEAPSGAESASDQSDGSLASEDDSDDDLADDSGTGADSDDDLADDSDTGEEASSGAAASDQSASDGSLASDDDSEDDSDVYESFANSAPQPPPPPSPPSSPPPSPPSAAQLPSEETDDVEDECEFCHVGDNSCTCVRFFARNIAHNLWCFKFPHSMILEDAVSHIMATWHQANALLYYEDAYLMLNGRGMDQSRSLSDNGVTHHCTIHFIPRNASDDAEIDDCIRRI